MKIVTGIASTTHIDLQCQRMTKGALDGMARQINERFIPQLDEHDPNQPVGVVLCGEVFRLGDGEYALGVVMGIFETDDDSKTFPLGGPNDAWASYKGHLNIPELLALCEEKQKSRAKVPPYERSQLNVADLLEIHLDSTQVSIDGIVYGIKKFIASTGDLKIEVYPKDHSPKHFHVISKQRGINARFDLNSQELIDISNGEINPSDVKKIQHFFKSRPDMLEKLKAEHLRLQK